MSEPPILPDPSGSEEQANPFASPAHVPGSLYMGDATTNGGTAKYGAVFWTSVLVMGLLLLCITIAAWPSGIFFGWIYLFGLIRVPIVINKRIKYGNPQRLSLDAGPVVWLSWVLVFAMTFAALTAFVVACTPGMLLGLSLAGPSGPQADNYAYLTFGVAGLISLIVFGLLYRLSLRY